MGNCNNCLQTQQETNNNLKNDSFVHITIQTWSKESHGLFDYESPNITISELKINNSSFINFTLDSIQLSNSKNDQLYQLLVQKQNGIFWLNNQSKNQLFSDNIYLNVNSLQKINKDGSQLKAGDEIKLGRIKLKIHELILNQITLNLNQEYYQENIQISQILEQKTEGDSDSEIATNKSLKIDNLICSNQACRICLGDSVDNTNPLISPCKCIGSMQFVHYNCLQTWIFKRNQLSEPRNENCIFIINKKLICELCQTKYPFLIEHKGQNLDLIQILRPIGKPYVLMEQINYNNISMGFHILTLKNQQKYNIGRSHICDVRISDISVSRQHATLNFINNQLFVQDRDSKFGTLTMLKENLPITKDFGLICIQIGRHVLKMQVKNESNNFCPINQCCNQPVQHLESSEEDEQSISEEEL